MFTKTKNKLTKEEVESFEKKEWEVQQPIENKIVNMMVWKFKMINELRLFSYWIFWLVKKIMHELFVPCKWE